MVEELHRDSPAAGEVPIPLTVPGYLDRLTKAMGPGVDETAAGAATRPGFDE